MPALVISSSKTTVTFISEVESTARLALYMKMARACGRVVCGDLHTACLTDRGILMTFGNGSSGCLGHGNLHDLDKVGLRC